MFTIFAIVLTLVGGWLFASGGIKRPFPEFTWVNNLGGVLLVIAFLLWVCVILALVWRFVAWAWVALP